MKQYNTRPIIIIFALTFILAMIVSPFAAQEALPLPVEADRQVDACDTINVCVTRFEPAIFQQETGGTMTVYGQNFSQTDKVRLVGYGLLQTTWISSGIMTASVPANIIAAGQYRLHIVNEAGQRIARSGDVNIVGKPQEVPQIPTQPAPTPGAPGLVVRNFQSSPNPVSVGSVVTIQLELVNQGTGPALGIVATLGEGDKFSPAGTASFTVGDMPPGTTRTVQITALVGESVTNGINTVPVRISYRSAGGETRDTSAAATVNVIKTEETSLLTMSGYQIAPEAVKPGDIVNIKFTIMNAGTRDALNGLLRISGDNSVLLPADRGDTLLIGNVSPGGVLTLDMPMRVSQTAKSGSQVQSIAITYTDGAESRTFNTSIAINVETALIPAPLMLVREYNIGDLSELVPGQTFSLKAVIDNIGTGDATNLLVSFGATITETEDISGTPEPGSPPGGGSGGSTGTIFAPTGTGETRYFERFDAGDSLELEQQFLVSGTVKSGIYNLPIVVRYTSTDGTQKQTTLPLNLLVVAQPRLQTQLMAPIPEMMEAGMPVTLSWQLTNLDNTDIKINNALVMAENGEVVNGADVFLGTLKGEKKSSFEATIIPTAEGEIKISMTLNYLDDMNRSQQLVYEYSAQVTAPFVPEEPIDPGNQPPVIEETPTPEPPRDVVQDLIFGLLGLGR